MLLMWFTNSPAIEITIHNTERTCHIMSNMFMDTYFWFRNERVHASNPLTLLGIFGLLVVIVVGWLLLGVT